MHKHIISISPAKCKLIPRIPARACCLKLKDTVVADEERELRGRCLKIEDTEGAGVFD
jgi:hypothetical protein